MPPQNIVPNKNSATLQGTMQTQPSAVITSDLATNITNKNLETLAQEEANMKVRLEQDKIMRAQKEADAIKAKEAEKKTAVDKQISDTLGVQPEVVDPVKVKKEKEMENIKMTIDNISRQVDPITADTLNNLLTLVLTQQ